MVLLQHMFGIMFGTIYSPTDIRVDQKKDFDALKKDWIEFSRKKLLTIMTSWQDIAFSKRELQN